MMRGFLILWLGLLTVAARADSDVEREVQRLFDQQARIFHDVPVMSPDTVMGLRASGRTVILVDVRSPREREVSAIPGSTSHRSLNASDLRDPQAVIVAYCTIGARSGRFARRANRRGARVHNLEGSLLGWLHAGGTVVSPHGRQTRRVHVYGPTWNLLPEGYQGEW
jgi:sodium/bile acid cotransporter 7